MYPLTIGERLEKGIKNKILLQSDEAVVITAEEEFDDTLPDGKEEGGNFSWGVEIQLRGGTSCHH